MPERGYRVLESSLLEPEQLAHAQFADEVLVGLSERPKRLSSRFIYDAEGSRLFQAITELEEYYPTRCEAEILTEHGDVILGCGGKRPLNLVDLGAGDGRKTAILLERAQALGIDARYVPIDISEAAMEDLVERMGRRFPGLPIAGLVSEYDEGVRWLQQEDARHNVVLFLGSNIGNFDRAAARAFLRRLWRALAPDDHVLIGFDLKKDIDALLAAYNDREGVTASFNLNLLRRINTELGADFDVDRFRHYSTYDVFSGAMESYLVSLDRQTVRLGELGDTVEFTPWEPIHTEYSYKYLESDVDRLRDHGGFADDGRFFDARRWFCDALWRVLR